MLLNVMLYLCKLVIFCSVDHGNLIRILCIMVGQTSILLCTMIRKLCYILSPEAIVKDDVAKASKLKS